MDTFTLLALHIKQHRSVVQWCHFPEQHTLHSLLSTDWFQERISTWFTKAECCLFHNQTEIY